MLWLKIGKMDFKCSNWNCRLMVLCFLLVFLFFFFFFVFNSFIYFTQILCSPVTFVYILITAEAGSFKGFGIYWWNWRKLDKQETFQLHFELWKLSKLDMVSCATTGVLSSSWFYEKFFCFCYRASVHSSFKNFWGATTLLIWAISPALSEFWIHSILWWQIYPIQVNVVNLQALEN